MSNDWSQGGAGNGSGGNGYGGPPGAPPPGQQGYVPHGYAPAAQQQQPPQGYGPPQGYAPPMHPHGAQQQQQQQHAYGPPQGYGRPRGYPPPQQQPQQPQQQQQQGYGHPPQGDMPPQDNYGYNGGPPGGATALGVPLEQGERVLFFELPNYSTDKIVLWVFGVLTLVILIGIIFIVMAIRYDKTNPRGNFVTNYRVVHVSGKGEVISLPLREIVDLDVERQRTNAGGGGLLGAAISAGVNAIQDNMANKKGKQDPKFWNRAIAVIMVTSQGRISFASRKAKDMGVLLANALPNLAAIEQYPNVPFQP